VDKRNQTNRTFSGTKGPVAALALGTHCAAPRCCGAASCRLKVFLVSDIADNTMSAESLENCRRAFVIQILAPPIKPPNPIAICKLAKTPLAQSLVNQLCDGAYANTAKVADVVSYVSDLTSLAAATATQIAIMRKDPEVLPTTLSGVAFPYIAALRFGLTLGIPEPPVHVAESGIQGLGVFATRDIKQNELVTTYPVDALRVHMNLCNNKDLNPYAYMYRDGGFEGIYAEQHWDDYKMHAQSIAARVRYDRQSICFFGNPNVYTPHACGHMINDPKNTTHRANCVDCCLSGGSVTAILTTRAVAKGEELLMEYGEGYWSDRK